MKINNILVTYFSHSGNTREIANQIKEKLDCDIFEIKTEKPYPIGYNECVKQAKQEHDEGYKPKLKTKVDNINQYNIIFIGYPMWWYTIPMPVATFLTEYDFSGKTIIPFCTHGGGGLSNSVDDIKKFCPQSIVEKALVIKGSDVKNAQKEVSEWLHKFDIIK